MLVGILMALVMGMCILAMHISGQLEVERARRKALEGRLLQAEREMKALAEYHRREWQKTMMMENCGRLGIFSGRLWAGFSKN